MYLQHLEQIYINSFTHNCSFVCFCIISIHYYRWTVKSLCW